MRIIKYLLLILLLVIVAGSVYFATKDGTYDVSKTMEMDAPAPVAYNSVTDYRSWQEWGPWMQEDPELRMFFTDSLTGKGAGYSWTSDKVGDGRIETSLLSPNDSIVQQIVFDTPLGESPGEIYWKFDPTEDGGSHVTWGMRGEHSFMEKVFMTLGGGNFDARLKDMFEKGLKNLDTYTQKVMNVFEIEIQGVTRHSGGYYLFVTSASRRADLGDRMAPMFGELVRFTTQNNIPVTGMPFTLYDEVDEASGNVIFSTALPVSERVITPSGSAVLCRYMEPVSALKTTLKGKYDYLSKAYAKAQAHIDQTPGISRDPDGKMFEVYRNDPGEHPNPANWLTDIYIPVLQLSVMEENQDL